MTLRSPQQPNSFCDFVSKVSLSRLRTEASSNSQEDRLKLSHCCDDPPQSSTCCSFARSVSKAQLTLHDHLPLASHHWGLHIFPVPLRFSVSIHPLTHLRVLKEEGPWCNFEGEFLYFCLIQTFASVPGRGAEHSSPHCGSDGRYVSAAVRRLWVWN